MSDRKRILVAVDFSICSMKVIEAAMQRLDRESGRLLLLHVAQLPPGLDADADVTIGGQTGAAQRLLDQSSVLRLEDLAKQAAAQGAMVKTIVRHGSPAETICETASEHGAELIVVGTHGRTGLARLLEGSVAAEVISHASCAVLTVPSQHHTGCAAASCATCESHVTPELRQLMVEREG